MIRASSQKSGTMVSLCDMIHVMKHSLIGTMKMPVGTSGRVVVEMDPELKQLLYSALEKDGLTLKDWFIRNATSYLDQVVQPSLFGPTIDTKREVSR